MKKRVSSVCGMIKEGRGASLLLLAFLILIPAGTSRAAFRDNGWGVRSVGLGGAFTARADDASSASWNPAGFTQFDRPEVTFMHERLYMGLDGVNIGTSYAALVIPASNSISYGLSWANLNSRDQYQENSFSLSLAGDLNGLIDMAPLVSLGLNVKYLEHKFSLDEYNQGNPIFDSGTGKGALTGDAALLVRYLRNRRGVSFGFMAKNLTQPDVGLKAEDRVPMELRGGMAFYLGNMRFGSLFIIRDITPSLEVSWRDGVTNYHIGWESWFLGRSLGIRAGGNLQEATMGLSYVNEKLIGLGIQVDYSLRLPFEIVESYGSHRIGLTFRFGESMEEVRKKRKASDSKVKRLQEEVRAARALAEEETSKRKELEKLLQAALEKRLNVSKEERGLVITIRPHFLPNETKIREVDKPSIDQVVEILKAYPAFKVIVEGHSDNVGRESYNLELSKKRAESVTQYMVKQGIEFSRLVAVGIGEARPVAKNSTTKGRAMNRRVEFVIIGR